MDFGLEVFYKGPNNHLWESWHNDGQPWWSAPDDMSGVLSTSAPSAVRTSDSLDIFYRGPNGNLWEIWRKNSDPAWSAPTDLGGNQMLSGPSASIDTDPRATAETISIFYRGPNNNIWKRVWNSTSFWAAPLDLTQNIGDSLPVLLSFSDYVPQYLFRTTDGLLRYSSGFSFAECTMSCSYVATHPIPSGKQIEYSPPSTTARTLEN